MAKKNKKLPTVPYFIGIEPQWTVLNGMAYGLTQPTLYGAIYTNIQHTEVFETLERIIANWLDIDITPSIENKRSVHSLMIKILTWQARLQQQHQVPIFEKFTIQAIPSTNINENRYLVALPYVVPEVTRELLSWFVFVVNYILANSNELAACSTKDLTSYLAEADQHLIRMRKQLKHYQLAGMNTYAFIHAADVLAIPVTHMALNVFRFGSGKNSQLLDSSFTEKTSVIGSKLAKSKSNTALALRKHGLPAPVHYKVSKKEQVASYCEKIGFPVVIKPDNLDQGQGVFAHLLTTKQALKAYKMAVKFSDKILIERHVYGDDYRFTVFDKQVIKIVKRTAGGIIGDGKLTVMKLVEKAQQSLFLQNVLRETGQMKLSLDEEALDLLSAQQLHKHAIPEAERFISLRRKSNLSTGGTVALINTCDVHPDNIVLAVSAAKALNLDLAGIDLLIPDVTKSWLESDAIICEVNAQPQIGALVTPHIYEDILESIMHNKKGIPLHLIIYPSEQHCLKSPQIESIMTQYQCNALAMKSGLWINEVKITKAFPNSFAAIKALVHNQEAEAALCIMSQQDIENSGLPLAKFASIDVYSDELFTNNAMINFVDKIKSHTDNLTCLKTGL